MCANPLTTAKIAEKPARQIDQVHALIDQFAAAGLLRVRAPLLLVADAAAVAVAAAHEHQVAERACVEQLAGLAERGMIAMVEADAHEPATSSGRFDQRIELAQRAAGRLLDEDVLAGRDEPQCAISASASLVVATMTMSTSADRWRPASLRRPASPEQCAPARRRVHAAHPRSTSAAHRPARRRAFDRSGRSRRSRRRGSPVSPREAAVVRNDAPQRVESVRSDRRDARASVSQGSHTALSSLPVMPSLAAEPRNTASAAPLASGVPPSSLLFDRCARGMFGRPARASRRELRRASAC